MSYLKSSLFDTIQMDDKEPPPPQRILLSMVCGHPHKRYFTRIDHRPGPGWMSDAWKGEACAACGKVLIEVKVY